MTVVFQGDVALLHIEALPPGALKVTKPLNGLEREAYGYHPEKGLVLAQGESRNHYHAFRDTEAVEMYHLPGDKPRLFLVVNRGPQPLVHEEHKEIPIAPGVHEIFYQQEENFEGEYRRVAD